MNNESKILSLKEKVENAFEKEREIYPFIVFDASFILNGSLNEKGFNQKEFLQKCSRLSIYAHLDGLIPEKIAGEVADNVSEYAHMEEVKIALSHLKRIPYCKSIQPQRWMHNYELFYDNLLVASKLLAKKNKRINVSKNDLHLSAYALAHTLEKDVVLATRDLLVASITQAVFDNTRMYIEHRGKLGTRLYIAEDEKTLQDRIKKIRTQLALRKFHQANNGCSPLERAILEKKLWLSA